MCVCVCVFLCASSAGPACAVNGNRIACLLVYSSGWVEIKRFVQCWCTCSLHGVYRHQVETLAALNLSICTVLCRAHKRQQVSSKICGKEKGLSQRSRESQVPGY